MGKTFKPTVLVAAAVGSFVVGCAALLGIGLVISRRPDPGPPGPGPSAPPPPAPAAETRPESVPIARLPLPPAGPAQGPPPALDPPPVPAAPETPAEPPPAAGLNTPVVLDGVAVAVAGAMIDRAANDMWLVVRITTTEPTRKYTYTSWEPRGGRGSAALADDAGNTYRAAPMNPVRTAVIRAAVREDSGGRIDYGPGPVYAGKPRADVLIFERPVDGCRFLDLELDGRQLGVAGTFRFRLPRAALDRPGGGPVAGPAPPADRPAAVFKEGDRVTLAGAGGDVILGKTRPALEEYRRAEAARDRDTMTVLVSEGKVVKVDPGTDAKVFGSADGLYWVRIATGPHRDRLGYVAAADVTRPGGRK